MSEIDGNSIGTSVIVAEPVSDSPDPSRPWLNRWKPGVSPNPSGRPRTKEIRQIMLKLLKEKPRGQKDTRLTLMLLRLYKHDPKTYMAYCYGKPVETHLLATMDGQEQGVNPVALAIARELAKDL